MTFKQIATTVLLTVFSLTSFATDYYTATTSLNVRSGAGTDYSVLFALNSGDEVELITQDNDWYQIKFNEQTGYASSKYLRFSRTATTAVDNENSETKSDNTNIIAIGVIIGIILLIIFFASGKKQSQPQTNISSPTATQHQSQPRVIVTKSTKSPGLAIFLAIIFPYFGVLYATVSGFFWLFFSYIGMWAFLFYWGIKTLDDGWLYIGFVLSMLHWLISIIWAGVSASNYNKRILTGI